MADYDTDSHKTDNGVSITPGLRVFTNDWEWGTVEPGQCTSGAVSDPGGEWFNGWFRVALDSGSTKIYNGERMTTVRPT